MLLVLCGRIQKTCRALLFEKAILQKYIQGPTYGIYECGIWISTRTALIPTVRYKTSCCCMLKVHYWSDLCTYLPATPHSVLPLMEVCTHSRIKKPSAAGRKWKCGPLQGQLTVPGYSGAEPWNLWGASSLVAFTCSQA